MPVLTIQIQAEACDHTAVTALLAERGDRPPDVDQVHDILGTLIETRHAEEGTQDPGDQDGLTFRTIPIGGQLLSTPTLAARIKLNAMDRWTIPDPWAGHPAEWIASLSGFILAHGREPLAIETLSPDTAPGLVEAWITPMPCTAHELAEAVRDLLGHGYPPVDPDTPSRKKALGDPTPPPSSSDSPKPSPAATPTIGSTKSPRPTSIGFAVPPPTAPPSATPPSTPTAAPPTIPESTPESAGAHSGTDSRSIDD